MESASYDAAILSNNSCLNSLSPFLGAFLFGGIVKTFNTKMKDFDIVGSEQFMLYCAIEYSLIYIRINLWLGLGLGFKLILL